MILQSGGALERETYKVKHNEIVEWELKGAKEDDLTRIRFEID